MNIEFSLEELKVIEELVKEKSDKTAWVIENKPDLKNIAHLKSRLEIYATIINKMPEEFTGSQGEKQ